VAPRRRAGTGARRTRDPRGAGRARTRAGGPLHLGGDGAADAPGLRGGRRVSRVTAVVVHWRDAEDTRGCLESLAAEPGLDVVVVDNGARPPLGALAAPVVCLRSEENLGYAGGANLGIAAALERGADTVLLLNNDARVLPGATAAAVRVLASDPRVAVVGPKVLAREDPSRLWLAWGRVTYRQSRASLCARRDPNGPPVARARHAERGASSGLWVRGAEGAQPRAVGHPAPRAP